MKFLRPTTFASLVLLCFACQPVDPLKDITIGIDLNIFKTYVSFRFTDAQTGNLIGKNDGLTVTLSVSGTDARAVVTQTGERLNPFVSVSGMISVALDPYDPYKIGPDNPVTFSFEASVPGYLPTRSSLSLTETGTHVCLVAMQRTGQPETGKQSYKVLPGSLEDGILSDGFRLATPNNSFELEFPDSLELLNEEGNPVSGELTVEAAGYSGLQYAGIDATRVMQFSGDQGVQTGLFEPVSILSVDIQTDNGTRLTQLPGRKVTWRFPAPAGSPLADSIPVWRFNPDVRIWEPAGYAIFTESDTSKYYSIGLNHFSLFGAGEVTSTRSLSGQLTFIYEKPFATASFPAAVVVTGPDNPFALQVSEITIRDGLPVPLTLEIPVSTPVTVTVLAFGDYEFSSNPASLIVQPQDESFSETFTIRPLKCRLSGTATGSFGSGDVSYPVPAFLKIIHATTGAVYQSVSVSVTSSGFDIPVSLMVYENQPVVLRLMPADLIHDFIPDPSEIRIEDPCLENGAWNFSLTPNTCQVISTIPIGLVRASMPEPVPAILRIKRASDGRLILEKPVTLSPGNNPVKLNLTVPKNTPLALTVGQAHSDRPITATPAEIVWEDPCGQPVMDGFQVTPQYTYLQGTLDFTFDPGLTHTEVPVNLIVYKTAGEQVIFSEKVTVSRANHEVILGHYVPAEPVVLKITRANPDIRFNPVPFKIDIPDPSLILPPYSILLKPTELVPVHFLVKVVCPGGEILPTVQGYYRIPGQDWIEMNIISGNLNLTVELGLTYEVGMILGGVMIDSTFTVDKTENDLTFPLDASDCEKMGWR